MIAPTVLLVDDDSVQNCKVANHLCQLDLDVLFARTKEEALSLLQNRGVQITLLEIGLGSGSACCTERPARTTDLPGLEILDIVHNRWPYLPVIVVTDHFDPLNERIAILNGADAFLQKPVDLNLLTAYIHGKLKSELLIGTHSECGTSSSHQPLNQSDFLMVEGLLIDLTNRQVKAGDGPYLSLSEREANLLSLMGSAPDRVFSRCELLRRVWGQDSDFGYDAVDATVKRIRKKIDKTHNGNRILMTVRGRGYVLSG